MTHYGVLVTGYGKRRRYTIRGIYWCGSSAPIDGVVYRTAEAALAAAEKMGIEIEAVGDCYHISYICR